MCVAFSLHHTFSKSSIRSRLFRNYFQNGNNPRLSISFGEEPRVIPEGAVERVRAEDLADVTLFIEAKGGIHGEIPIAKLPENYMDKIGAKTDAIQLSSDTLQKNALHHPEITTQDYLSLQTIIERAQLVVQDGENTLVFIETGERIYHAAIKATQTGQGVFMTSLRLTHEKELERMKRVGRIIKE